MKSSRRRVYRDSMSPMLHVYPSPQSGGGHHMLPLACPSIKPSDSSGPMSCKRMSVYGLIV